MGQKPALLKGYIPIQHTRNDLKLNYQGIFAK
jgi:hypothetical protein